MLKSAFDPNDYLSDDGTGRSVMHLTVGDNLFSQGERTEAVFYIQKGHAKLTVLSEKGKSATITLLAPGDFVGEEVMAGVKIRLTTATAISVCTVLQIKKREMIKIMEQPLFASIFTAFLLRRNLRIQADLVDQLFNSSEKRLARALLLMAEFEKPSDGKEKHAIPHITQEALADLIGTTRARVSSFMNRFRKLNYITYGGGGKTWVHRSLLSVVLHDQLPEDNSKRPTMKVLHTELAQ